MLEHPLAPLKSEIPFDFNRKRLSVVVRHADEYLLITKGEAESVFGICETVAIDGVPQPFDNSRLAEAECTLKRAKRRRLPCSWRRGTKSGKAGCLCRPNRTCHDAGRLRGISRST